MAKIVRYEFMGNWIFFWFMCITVVGIPLAVLYLVDGTVRVEEELDDPERFLTQFRSRRK